jgi:hypothetical protein
VAPSRRSQPGNDAFEVDSGITLDEWALNTVVCMFPAVTPNIKSTTDDSACDNKFLDMNLAPGDSLPGGNQNEQEKESPCRGPTQKPFIDHIARHCKELLIVGNGCLVNIETKG